MVSIGALIYDIFLAPSEKACVRKWRGELLSKVSGTVLEIGAGTGANVEFYSSDVTELILSEPQNHMMSKLKDRLPNASCKNIKLAKYRVESIDLSDSSVDYVVSTLVLCSVKNPRAALAEIFRVLKPNGALVFIEHIASKTDPGRRKWQNLINPFWKVMAGNCHLNRETEKELLQAGFTLNDVIMDEVKRALPVLSPAIRGFAYKS